jgi:hypothetical protein
LSRIHSRRASIATRSCAVSKSASIVPPAVPAVPDADLAEDDVREMLRCIRLCLDCADACDATGRIVTRQTAPDLRLIRAIVEACAVACLACAEECDRHAAHHEHCRLCAEACRRCKKACDDLLATIG